VVLLAMLTNGGLVALLVLVIAWEVISLLLANRRGRAAARLHIRIVALFSLVATAPAVLLAIAASVSLDRGLDNWFSTRTAPSSTIRCRSRRPMPSSRRSSSASICCRSKPRYSAGQAS